MKAIVLIPGLSVGTLAVSAVLAVAEAASAVAVRAVVAAASAVAVAPVVEAAVAAELEEEGDLLYIVDSFFI